MNPTRFRYRLLVKRVYRRTRGSVLAQTVTAVSPADGQDLKVEHVTDFKVNGGWGVFEPDKANEERFRYRSVDEARDLVLGVARTDPKAHAEGVFVQAGKTRNRERFADGFLEDEDRISKGILIPPRLVWNFELGVRRRDEDMESVWVEGREDGLVITDVGLGPPERHRFFYSGVAPSETFTAPNDLDTDCRIYQLRMRAGVAPTGGSFSAKVFRNREGSAAVQVGDTLVLPSGSKQVVLKMRELIKGVAGPLDCLEDDWFSVQFIKGTSSATANVGVIVVTRDKV